jgi:hypothetical protein
MSKKPVSKAQQRANETMARIIDRFQSGNIPEPLATMYIQRRLGESPMTTWSWLNQFACVIAGCTDARGFKQWQEVGRTVCKGEQAATYILFPLMKKQEQEDPTTGETEEFKRIYGFKGAAVFDVTQTEGDPLEHAAEIEAEQTFIQSLPLIDVADHWGIDVNLYAGVAGRARGRASFGSVPRISLGVENVDTWLHELIHHADSRLGSLVERGQHWRSETVAQFGAATLATLLNMEHEANLGKTYRYIEAYAEDASLSAIQACQKVLERTMQAVTLVMETAEELAEAVPA